MHLFEEHFALRETPRGVRVDHEVGPQLRGPRVAFLQKTLRIDEQQSIRRAFEEHGEALLLRKHCPAEVCDRREPRDDPITPGHRVVEG